MSPALVAQTHPPGDQIPAVTPIQASGGTLTAGTPVQNNQGYHAILSIGVVVSTATAATITGGTGTTSALALSGAITLIGTFTLASVNWNQITLFVPSNYFAVINTTGTITVTTLTAVWFPA